MIIYVQNICWGFNPFEVTEEEINKLPIRTELKIDTDLCDNLEDIKLYYTEDVDNLTDNRFQIEDFDYSLLGYNLDIEETITTKTYIDYRRSEHHIADLEQQIAEADDNLRWG
jgi:hypothetical protein